MIYKNIELVIFDLDGTLLDYRSAENLAKYRITRDLVSVDVDAVDYWRIFSFVNKDMFRDMIAGVISKEDYRVGRFSRTLGLTVKKQIYSGGELRLFGKSFNEIYMRTVNAEIEMFSDAVITLDILKKRNLKLAILTNGPADGQRKKINKFGLNEQVELVHISEETGFAKPNVDAFNNLLDACSVDKSNALMIGDSLEDDIEGANKGDIQTIWIDRDKVSTAFSGSRVESLVEIDFSVIG